MLSALTVALIAAAAMPCEKFRLQEMTSDDLLPRMPVSGSAIRS